jgi:hypothetical protein
MQDKYPRLTDNQVELWLNDPCTQALLSCLDWYQGDIKDEINKGTHVDPTNNDLTCNNYFRMTGRKEAFGLSCDFQTLFDRYGLMEEKEDEAA